MPVYSSRFEKILKDIDRCNDLYKKQKEKMELFDETLFMEEVDGKEVVNDEVQIFFEHLIFFSYQLIVERSGNNIKFLHNYYNLAQIDKRADEKFEHDVKNLRTYIGHFLKKGKPHDELIKEQCNLWFLENCNREFPRDKKEWQLCLESALEGLEQYIIHIQEILNVFASIDDYYIISQMWKDKQRAYVPQYRLDDALERVKEKYEIQINNEAFFRRYRTQITDLIELYGGMRVLEVVEKVCLEELDFYRISAAEVSERYSIQKKELGKAMKEVTKLYKTNQYIGKEEVFEYLDSIFKRSSI